MHDKNKRIARAAVAGGIIAAGVLALPGCVPQRDVPKDPPKPAVPENDPSHFATLYGPSEPQNIQKVEPRNANADLPEPSNDVEEVYGPAEWFDGDKDAS